MDALDKIRRGVEKARTKLAAQRLGHREFTVILRTITYPDAVDDAGYKGPPTIVNVTLSPTPSVSLRPVYRFLNGGVHRIGDALVGRISRLAYTEIDLKTATDWIIDGEAYTLVEGYLKVEPTEFIALLKRREATDNV